MCAALKAIRSSEAFHAVKMARIRACNMAMFFFIMPVSSFITFAAVCLASTHDPKHSPELTFLALIHVDSLQ